MDFLSVAVGATVELDDDLANDGGSSKGGCAVVPGVQGAWLGCWVDEAPADS
jgi:hypothetical protein